jgi:hypothetical protein
MRTIRAEAIAPQPAAPDAGRLAADKLDLRNSAVVQDELPGLKMAFDGGAMQGYLQPVLFGKGQARYVIERCAPGKAIYMGDSCAVRYQLQVKDNLSGQTIQPVVGGRIFQDQLTCALYLRDRLAPLAALMHGREEIAPFAAPVALIEPLNMVVHVFPIDGELPTLVGATDRQRMVEIFNETLPDALMGRFTAQDCRIVPVNYARRYRCVMRYEIAGQAPGSDRPLRRVVYGKVATDNQGALIGALIAVLVLLRLSLLFVERDELDLQRRAAQLALTQMAYQDGLTQLANRRALYESMGEAMAKAHGRATGLLFVDLNGFKAVNDTHGHAAGDAVLADVAWTYTQPFAESEPAAGLVSFLGEGIEVEINREAARELREAA